MIPLTCILIDRMLSTILSSLSAIIKSLLLTTVHDVNVKLVSLLNDDKEVESTSSATQLLA